MNKMMSVTKKIATFFAIVASLWPAFMLNRAILISTITFGGWGSLFEILDDGLINWPGLIFWPIMIMATLTVFFVIIIMITITMTIPSLLLMGMSYPLGKEFLGVWPIVMIVWFFCLFVS